MKTIKTIFLLVLIVFLITACNTSSKKDKQLLVNKKQPNIVVILADDLGYGDPEVYNSESKIPTPNINKLANNGMKFTDAHTPSSVCTPTRYGLLTGRYAWRTQLKKSVLWEWDQPLIEANRATLPKVLKQQGYHTACIGKWHLGWKWPGKIKGFVNDTVPMGDRSYKPRKDIWKKIDFNKNLGGGPLEAGFDYYFGDDVPNLAPYTFFENDKILTVPNQQKPKGMFGTPGPMAPNWNLTEVMPEITKKSVTYIKEQAKQKSPFFLYFALTAPHTPIAPTKEFKGKSKAGLYGDFVCEVDWAVGQVIDALKQTGQLENTIVVFTSDNGSPQRDGKNMSGKTGTILKYGHNPNKPFKGKKADIWEGGHRVPFIVSWPKKIKKGSTSNALVCLTDLMSTFQTITGFNNGNKGEDSFDISHILTGSSNEKGRKTVVHHSIDGTFSIRKGPWKLILGKTSGGWSKDKVVATKGQLYNLENDALEQNNVYQQYPELVAELSTYLKKYKEDGYSIQ